MKKNDYSILIGGEAGQGSRKAGLILSKIFSRLGYRIFIYDEYHSQIRGGDNFSKLRISEEKVLSHREKVDFLLALNKNTVLLHKNELEKNGKIICDKSETGLNLTNLIDVPLKEIVRKAKGTPLMENIALISFFGKLIGIDWYILESVLKKEIKKFQETNLKVAKIAFKTAKSFQKIKKINKKILPLLTGNQAVALGALKAGLDFYFAYPMTPATGILHFLASQRKKFNIGVSQLENEVGIINAAIGAASAGARTMVGTSGGGFALMTEGLSLACQSETPILIVESQRPAPATGVPTYTAQGDLLFTLFAGHGDILKFVAAPGDAEESFYWAGKLLNLSWKFQTPSILLIDKEISESTFSFDENILNKVKVEKPLLWKNSKQNYKRYKITKDGISPLAFYDQKNIISKITSYEHDEFGITVEDSDNIKKMQEKRLRKFEKMKKEAEKLEAVKIYGKKTAKTAIIAWGSTKGPVLEATKILNLKMIQPILLQPFPEKQIKKALKGVKKIILIETNATSQLEKILNSYEIKIQKKILKYDGRPFLPEEIIEKIKKYEKS